jgi:predicted phosphate transport protein (TIGR00153 family)
MKGSGNILSWIGHAEGQSVILVAEQHIQETCRTVAFLSEAIKAFVAGDLSAKTLAIEKVKESERAADKLVWRMIYDLSEGLLLPPDREDLMRFAKGLDKIADTTNRAAQLLGFIEGRPPDGVLKNMSISSELIIQAAEQLRQAIHAYGKNDLKDSLAHCQEVERLEHEADDQKRLLIDAILRAHLSSADLLLSYNLAEAMEAITDRIETSSDLIKVVAVKSR